MKVINLILLLLPLTGFSQVDTMTMNGYSCFGCDSTEFVIGYNKFITGDTLPKTTTLEYHLNTPWRTHTTELVKGKVETPVNVMDSGMKVEVVETRDTIYNCPSSFGYRVEYFNSNGQVEGSTVRDCKLDKIVTTRRYKLYIINEYGQKEYLSMELTKQK